MLREMDGDSDSAMDNKDCSNGKLSHFIKWLCSFKTAFYIIVLVNNNNTLVLCHMLSF